MNGSKWFMLLCRALHDLLIACGILFILVFVGVI